MPRYIELLPQLVRLYRLNLDCKEVIKEFLLTAETADVVEVVRCKDCKHKPIYADPEQGEVPYNLDYPDGSSVCPCIIGDRWYSWMPQDNWFCAYGERRDDGEIH